MFRYAKELNRLLDKELNKQELTKDERKYKEYLLDLWEQEQQEQEYKNWIANQPV